MRVASGAELLQGKLDEEELIVDEADVLMGALVVLELLVEDILVIVLAVLELSVDMDMEALDVEEVDMLIEVLEVDKEVCVRAASGAELLP